MTKFPASALWAALTLSPFLMAFDPHREEGLTLGAGGNLGRGHYSSSCAKEMYREEFSSAAVSAEYTFAQDSADWRWPQVTLGGRGGAAFSETRLVATLEKDSIWNRNEGPIRERRYAASEWLLHLDWKYVGVQGGVLTSIPEYKLGDRRFRVFPAGELRVGPWHRFYATYSLGSGFALPVSYPLEVAVGLGWQGSNFGGWLGQAGQFYESSETRLSLSYRLHPVTLLGSAGLLTKSDGSFPGHYEGGDPIRLALGLRWHL